MKVRPGWRANRDLGRLVESEAIAHDTRRHGRLLDVPPSQRARWLVTTLHGVVGVTLVNQRVFARGDRVRTAVVEVDHGVSIAIVKRGIDGRVGDRPVRISRSRYGFRRRDRDVLVDGVDLSWRTEYYGSRRYDIVRRVDGSVVYRRDRGRQFLDREATGDEVALALALAASDIIETSSFLNYLTL